MDKWYKQELISKELLLKLYIKMNRLTIILRS